MSDEQGWEDRPRLTKAERIAIGIPFAVIAGIVAAVAICGVVFAVWLGVSMGSQTTREPMNISTSPNGRWTARAYYHNPGPAASSWVTVDVVDSAGKQATWQIADLDGSDLADQRAWSGDNSVRMVWKTNTTVSIGLRDYSVVKPWWKEVVPNAPPVAFLVVSLLAVSMAVGYWCYRIWRRKGRRRWLGFFLGFLVSVVLTPVTGLACVSVSYGLADRNTGPGARSHVLIGSLVAAGIIVGFSVAFQAVLVRG
jgi:hypothetical protein